MQPIDARSQSCPAPVLMTKDAIERNHPEQITIIVDNAAAQQNVCRFLESAQYRTTVEKAGNDFHVLGTQKEGAPQQIPDSDAGVAAQAQCNAPQRHLVMITTDRMGFGDDALGQKLMVNFINTLKEMGSSLWRLVFVNNGVKLAVTGSEILPALQSLEENGVDIFVCGTCLTHFDLLEQKQVGETTNMLDIVTGMQVADKVINI